MRTLLFPLVAAMVLTSALTLAQTSGGSGGEASGSSASNGGASSSSASSSSSNSPSSGGPGGSGVSGMSGPGNSSAAAPGTGPQSTASTPSSNGNVGAGTYGGTPNPNATDPNAPTATTKSYDMAAALSAAQAKVANTTPAAVQANQAATKDAVKQAQDVHSTQGKTIGDLTKGAVDKAKTSGFTGSIGGSGGEQGYCMGKDHTKLGPDTCKQDKNGIWVVDYGQLDDKEADK